MDANSLYTENYGTICRKASYWGRMFQAKTRCTAMELEDFTQEMHMHVLRYIGRFDPSRTTMYRYIAMLTQTSYRHQTEAHVRRTATVMSESLISMLEHADRTIEDIAEREGVFTVDAPSDDGMQALMASVASLGGQMAEVVSMRMDGFRAVDIGVMLGVTRQRVHQILSEAEKSLKKGTSPSDFTIMSRGRESKGIKNKASTEENND